MGGEVSGPIFDWAMYGSMVRAKRREAGCKTAADL